MRWKQVAGHTIWELWDGDKHIATIQQVKKSWGLWMGADGLNRTLVDVIPDEDDYWATRRPLTVKRATTLEYLKLSAEDMLCR
jgi:hypothetical protein